MPSQSENEAAWIVAEKANPLEVKPAPKPTPGENEIVIKVAYAAVNPTDHKTQDAPYLPLNYPTILGVDVAGTVAQLGSKVTRFKVGQRVMGHCDSLLTQKSSNAGFQLYTVCRELLACPVPDSLPLANAAVLPLSVSTGAAALFINPEAQLPSNSPPQPTGKTVLVWGGSSSVGSSTIQLAVAAGLRVFATASKANCDYVKGLGASKAFDHREPNVVDQITSELGKGDFIVDCIGSPQTQQACGKILGAVGGGTLHLVLPPQATFPDNVTVNIVNGLAPGFAEEELNGPWGVGLDRVGKAVWRDYMPTALESGKFQAKPDPHVIKGGLTKVQDGIDMLRKGVSAKKIVIEIAEE